MRKIRINNAIDGLSAEIVSINDLVGTDTEGGCNGSL